VVAPPARTGYDHVVTKNLPLVLLTALIGFAAGWWTRRPAAPPPPPAIVDLPDIRGMIREEFEVVAGEMRRIPWEKLRAPPAPVAERVPAPLDGSQTRGERALLPEPDPRAFDDLLAQPDRGPGLPDSEFLLDVDAGLARFGRPDRSYTSGASTVVWEYDFPTGRHIGGEEIVRRYRLSFIHSRLYSMRGPLEEPR
jgi:hypothetical protein